MDVLGIPGELSIALYAIVAGSFLAAVSNAAFSSGGAMIVLAVTTTVLPVSAVVPIHSTLLIGSTLSRAVVFRQHVDWRIAGPFLVGSIVAVALTGMSLFKILGHTFNGFDYRLFAAVIVLSVLAAFLGTWVGKRINDRVSESLFRFVFRALVTVTALRLLYVNLANS